MSSTAKPEFAGAEPLPAGRAVVPDPTLVHIAQEFKHTAPLLSCRFDASGRFVFAGAHDNTVQRWDLVSGHRTTLDAHKTWVRAMVAVPGTNLFVTGDYRGGLIWWPADADAPNPLHRVAGHASWVRALAVSPDAKFVASCGNDGQVKVWGATDGKPTSSFPGHTSEAYHVAFHPTEPMLASVDLKGLVKVWDLTTGKAERELDAGVLYKYQDGQRCHLGGVRGLSFDPAGKQLACAGITDVTNALAGQGKPLVVLFDWASGTKKLLKPKADFQGTAWGVGFHSAGFLVAAGGGNGGAVWFWKPTEALSFHTFPVPANGRDLDLHPDGLRLAVAFYDGAVRVLSMTPGPQTNSVPTKMKQ